MKDEGRMESAQGTRGNSHGVPGKLRRSGVGVRVGGGSELLF